MAKRYLVEGCCDGSLFGDSVIADSQEEAEELAIAMLNEAWGQDCTELDELCDEGATVTEYSADMYARDAGPELLAALERLLPVAERAFGELTTDLDPAREIIAKAKGQTL